MFSLIDIADMHRKLNHRSLYDRCDVSTCKTDRTFKSKYGIVPPEQCDFSEAYNEIVSSKGEELRTYVIGTTLWAFIDNYNLNTASSVNLMLMLYVLSRHCDGRYDNVAFVGYWDRKYGAIIRMPVGDISQVTLDSINYNYLGYIKNEEPWVKSKGTNKNILYEKVAYFKHNCKYRSVLTNFKYEETEHKFIVGFEETAKYPIIREANNYLAPPVKYGGSEYEKIKINYISDIHIGHHIDKEKPVKPQIQKIVRELIESQQDGLFFFGGDTAVDRIHCALFYKDYMTRRQYVYYKEWKKRNKYRPTLTAPEAIAAYEKKLADLLQKKAKEIRWLKPWFSYTKKFEEKNASEMDTYIESSYFKSKHYPEFVSLRLKKIKKIEQVTAKFVEDKETYLVKLQKGFGGKDYIKHEIGDVFAVLGNHEMSNFNSVSDALLYYTPLFKSLGIHFLNNSFLGNDSLIIFGGCGFAKYNMEFNALNTLNARSFTREDEIKETDNFIVGYHKAHDKAKAERKPLIVLAHYPTKDFLENDQCDSQAVYFTGHTHRNTSESTEQRYIFADNQVGYKRKAIVFKTARLGTVQNPFIDFEDGCYEITTDQYCDFYKYNGDPLSGDSIINNVLRNGGRFLMIKHTGFYGFFTQNKLMEISICVGGKTRKIPRVKSVSYLMKYFDAMVSEYLTALLPFRKAQEQISVEVQSLGLSGRIHGCIVDVDFYHHIMLNPLDGTMTYYYSPIFGMLQPYKTFAKLLEHIDADYLLDGQKKDAQDKYKLMAMADCMLSKESFPTSSEVGEMVTIDIKDSIYSLSSRINQLQRLFTSRILRDWNDDLINKHRDKNTKQIEDGSRKRG
ncbi:MAG: metallophosphoesterase [Clostridiaceae bacterium]|nr:metallophosphoesterase [Clostridiaceae bacterium]